MSKIVTIFFIFLSLGAQASLDVDSYLSELKDLRIVPAKNIAFNKALKASLTHFEQALIDFKGYHEKINNNKSTKYMEADFNALENSTNKFLDEYSKIVSYYSLVEKPNRAPLMLKLTEYFHLLQQKHLGHLSNEYLDGLTEIAKNRTEFYNLDKGAVGLEDAGSKTKVFDPSKAQMRYYNLLTATMAASSAYLYTQADMLMASVFGIISGSMIAYSFLIAIENDRYNRTIAKGIQSAYSVKKTKKVMADTFSELKSKNNNSCKTSFLN